MLTMVWLLAVTLTPDQYYNLPLQLQSPLAARQRPKVQIIHTTRWTGEVVIKASVVTGAVVIEATAPPQPTAITETYTNITSTGDTTATHGEDVDVTLQPTKIIVARHHYCTHWRKIRSC